MTVSVANLAACDGIVEDDDGLCTLVRVRSEWAKPPARFAVWVEFLNQAEAGFTFHFEIWRGTEFVGETEEELVLDREPKTQRWRQFVIDGLQRKTYKIVVLIGTEVARILMLDFGAGGAP